MKFENRISIIASGYDSKFISFNPMFYMYEAIIDRYKNDYDFLDLNGLANSFGQSSPYYKYNESKIGMNPDVYEFIGEFDFIINEGKFRRIQAAGLLSEEFKPSYRLESEQ